MEAKCAVAEMEHALQELIYAVKKEEHGGGVSRQDSTPSSIPASIKSESDSSDPEDSSCKKVEETQ